MARKPHQDVLGVNEAETVIGSGVVVKGDLTSEADMIIDGTLVGDIKARGDITIGMNAQIKANIQGANITIAGAVHGNILSSGEVTIRETGSVKGDIKANGLAISSGGVFSGRSHMEMPGQPASDTDHHT